MIKNISQKQYFMIKYIIKALVIIGISIPIYAIVGSVLLDYTNNQIGYILLGSLVMFIITYLFARYTGVPDSEIEYKFLMEELSIKGLNELKTSISKERLISYMRESEYMEISKTVYAKQIKGFFVKNILVVLIKEYRDFKKFNESDSLNSKIRNHFKLPSNQDIQNDIRKLRSYKIHTLEIVYLESVSDTDIKAYQHETAQSITHNLGECGVLYDKSRGIFLYYDFHKKTKNQKKTFLDISFMQE